MVVMGLPPTSAASEPSGRTRAGRPSRLLVAAGAGFALADSAIVTLALPALLIELDTTVEGVAAVIGVYTAALAIGLPLAARMLRRARIGTPAFALFAAASAGCAVADSLELLLVLRALQGLGGAGALAAAFPVVAHQGGGGRLWPAVAVLGVAIGPALGGVLTEAFEWRAIFAVQAPIAVAAAVALRDAALPAPWEERAARDPIGPALALALVSAALSAVLFLLVLLLIAGWSLSPIAAAATVTVLPAAALAASRIGGEPRSRAAAGCLLVAGGVASLAFLPSASAWWTIAPQLLAGAGMGLSLPALAGHLLPERTAAEAANLLAIRHAGIAVALIALAPLVSANLDDSIERAQERGVALVLDARIGPLDKLDLAPELLGAVDTDDPRDELRRAFRQRADELAGDERAAFRNLRERADDTVTQAAIEAFEPAFLISAALALLAAAACRPPLGRPLATAGAVAAVCVGAYGTLDTAAGPEPVELADPCEDRDLPDTGGIEGGLQDIALSSLDRAACRHGATREELVLALGDAERRAEYEREHGVDPRSIDGLLDGLF
ncbi:MAG: MFS transporter [Thermoleophilaceae bacterium]